MTNSTWLYLLGMLIVVLAIIQLVILLQTRKKSQLLNISLQNINNLQYQQKTEMLVKQQKVETQVEDIGKLQQSLQDTLLQLGTQIQKDSASSSQVISDISTQVHSLNNIMVNNKTRGTWGEYQLETLLTAYAGTSHGIFEKQYPLSNHTIGDIALHIPGSEKVLIIDSKFPLQNFERLMQEGISESDRQAYHKAFCKDVLKHISDISTKYITSETQPIAMMFIPSEAMYVYICDKCADLLQKAYASHVLLASPTSLLGIVFTLVNATKDWNRGQNLKSIEQSIINFAEDGRRLEERVEKCQKTLSSLQTMLTQVETSSRKINQGIQKFSERKEEV